MIYRLGSTADEVRGYWQADVAEIRRLLNEIVSSPEDQAAHDIEMIHVISGLVWQRSMDSHFVRLLQSFIAIDASFPRGDSFSWRDASRVGATCSALIYWARAWALVAGLALQHTDSSAVLKLLPDDEFKKILETSSTPQTMTPSAMSSSSNVLATVQHADAMPGEIGQIGEMSFDELDLELELEDDDEDEDEDVDEDDDHDKGDDGEGADASDARDPFVSDVSTHIADPAALRESRINEIRLVSFTIVTAICFAYCDHHILFCFSQCHLYRNEGNVLRYVDALPRANNTPFARLNSVLALAKAWQTDVHTRGLSFVDNSFTKISYRGLLLTLPIIGDGIKKLASDIENLIFTNLLPGMRVGAFKDIYLDNLRKRAPMTNYEGRRHLGHGIVEEFALSERWGPPLEHILTHFEESSRGQPASTRQQLLDTWINFYDQIVVLMFVMFQLHGYTPRATDTLKLRVRGLRPSPSSVTVTPDGRLEFVIVYKKNVALTGKEDLRFQICPPVVGNLMMILLVILNPCHTLVSLIIFVFS